MSGAGASELAAASPLAVPTGADTPACSNCGSSSVASYCADCGERQPTQHDYSVRAFVVELLNEVTSVDGRLVRSFVALVTKPGHLTREWFEGRRGRYVRPLSLFVMLNVLFFLIQPHTHLLSYKYQNYVYGHSPVAQRRVALVEHKRAGTHETPAEFAARFDANLQDQKKSLLIFCIPVLALALAVLYAGQHRYFTEHLVFSIHAYAFLLVFMGSLVPFLLLLFAALQAAKVPLSTVAWLDGDTGISILMAGVVGSYLYLAFRRVYGDGRVAAVLRAAVSLFLIGQLVDVYHDVLFYTTLYSL